MFSFTRSRRQGRLQKKIPGAGAAPKQAGFETLYIMNVFWNGNIGTNSFDFESSKENDAD